MATKQPTDDQIDLSDIPEVTDWTGAVRGRFHPDRIALEREVRRLQRENRALRDLLLAPDQGEYAYDDERAIDTAVAGRLAQAARDGGPRG
jgi:hypothetical protein